ncbi:MAG: Thioredoxin, partial [uncultured Phycisphaerae bacterium]
DDRELPEVRDEEPGGRVEAGRQAGLRPVQAVPGKRAGRRRAGRGRRRSPAGVDRRQFRAGAARRGRPAGAGGRVGDVVPALPGDRADDRPARRRVGRPLGGGQARRRRQPGDGPALPDREHPDAAHLQWRQARRANGRRAAEARDPGPAAEPRV